MPIPSLRAAPATFLLASLLAGLPAQSVTWQGKDVSISDLERQAPSAAKTALDWLPFAAAADYRLVLSDERQVLLVLNHGHARKRARSERPEVKKLLAILDRTIGVVEGLLGPPDGDSEPVVLVAALAPDYPKVLAQVAELDPRLTGWADAAGRSVAGFVLSEPLVAAWLDDGVGQREWDRHNELVHRTTQLLARHRAPQLPPWFALGLAWHVEDVVQGGIYCFPHRQGFVWAAEHGGWDKRLAVEFKPSRRRSGDLPGELTMQEFADWDPMHDAGDFDTQRALVAFGVVRFLAYQHPAAVVGVARAFDEAIRAGWRVTISATEWTTDPNFKLPAARQLEILQSVDPEFLAHVTEAFVRKKLGPVRASSRQR